MLLDPVEAADPGLLWFDENGQASPHPVCNHPNGYPDQRVKISIRLLHLNHSGLVDQRKVLCSEVRRCVEVANRYFAKYSVGDGTARGAFEGAVEDLKAKLSPEAEYSATDIPPKKWTPLSGKFG